MHAVIHLALKKHLEGHYGSQEWLRFLEAAGVPTGLPYVRLGAYPDEELFAIIAAAAQARSVPADVIWERFGAATAADLVTMYPKLVPREWRTLDVICRAEETIHRVVRRRLAGARPPVITCARVSPVEARLTYTSRRKLCAFARGIMRGVANHYGEVLTITHPSCTQLGNAVCEFVLRLDQEGK